MKWIIFIFLIICSIHSFGQINLDADEVKRKRISRIVFEEEDCTIDFDSKGRVTQMEFHHSSTDNELYVFDSLGNWTSLEKYDLGKKEGRWEKFTEQRLNNEFDESGSLILQECAVFGSNVKNGELPYLIDSFNYYSIIDENSRRNSEIELTVKRSYHLGSDSVLYRRSSYYEETEHFYRINDSTFHYDYFEIRYKDTTEQCRLICYVDSTDEIYRMDEYDFETAEMDRSYFDCKCDEPWVYQCYYTRQSELNKNATRRTFNLLQIHYTRNDLYQALPKSRASNDQLVFCFEPLKVLKSNRKAFGRSSVKLLKYE